MEDLVNVTMKTTSKVISERFGKAHRDVVRAIRNLECSEEFKVRNFAHCEFTNDKGLVYEGYELTRNGFSFLCMGFTGKKAAQWKEKFLQAFDAMEKALLESQRSVEWKLAREQIKQVRKDVTDTIKDFISYATSQGSSSAKMYYANITNMEYKALGLLEQSKQTVGNFRDTLDVLQISQLQLAESIAKIAIKKGMGDGLHYKEIYILAKQKVTDYAQSISWVNFIEHK